MKRRCMLATIATLVVLGVALGCDHHSHEDLPPCIEPPPPCIECPADWWLSCGQPCTAEGAYCIGVEMACLGGRWQCWTPDPPIEPDCEPVCQ